MTDRLKIVRIRARNVPRVHGHKRLDDDTFLASLSLSLQESDGVACSMHRGPVLLKHKKNRLRTACACVVVAFEQESYRDSMPSSLLHQI